jgi:type IV pilus assembly protein PilQ
MTLKVGLRTVILFSGFVLFGLAGAGRAADPSQQARITGIDWQETSDAFFVTIRSETPPTYTMYELVNPLRVVLDIADATLAESAGLPAKVNKGPVTAITGRMLDDQEPFITRIEIGLSHDRTYAVERDASNIKVKFTGLSSQAAVGKKPAASSPVKKTSVKGVMASRSSLLTDVVVTTNPSETRILLQAGEPITEYRKARLPQEFGRPNRLYIDIPNFKSADSNKQLPIGRALARVRVAPRGSGVRVVFDSGLEGPFQYEIETVPQGLLITVQEATATGPVAGLVKTERPRVEPVVPATSVLSKTASGRRPQEKPAPAPSQPPAARPLPALPDELAVAGYNTQKISVDFYKIDLHNVLRLIGEISGRNIVVDEAVNGTLTLALSEVPWDFVLDVVLNLKDLQKEERFNTIVISPKSKNFSWPKKPIDNLAIAADGSLIKQEALSIKKRQETPKEVTEAKKLIQQGNEQHRAGQYEAALSLYEEAYAKWPENQQLAGRMAAMALVQLGKNAKAVHYAKAVLELDPHNSEAALHAAIGLANMKKTAEAKEYFDQAIGSSRPSSEALLSYAAFCEENDSLQAALALLARHEEFHGSTLDSMVAKARLLDKLGRSEEANEEYRAILLSGFEIPADLKRYLQGRMAVANR